MSRTTSASRPVRRRSTSTLLTWGAVLLVIVIVVTLVVVKFTQGTDAPGTADGYQPASPALVSELTKIPASVYDRVGVNSPAATITPPIEIQGQPALTLTTSAGVQLPEVLYYGAEFCPFCAAERWSLIAALSRFGTLDGLGTTASSTTDQYPGTPTFTFVRTTFHSDVLAFRSVERYGNVAPDGQNYASLQVPTAAEATIVNKYDTPRFVGGTVPDTIPFISIGNRFLISGAGFSPGILAGLSRNQIAGDLRDPSNPVTKAIIANANYLTAAICEVTGDHPAAVWSSKGVQAAVRSMKSGG